MQVNIAKSLLSLSQISVQYKLLKCTKTMSWLCNGLAGMLSDSYRYSICKLNLWMHTVSERI